MHKSMLERYIENRKDSDPKFKEDFEKGFEEYKEKQEQIVEDIKEFQEKIDYNDDGSNVVKCVSCNLLYPEEEIDEDSGICFYCNVFLDHEVVS